MTWIVCSRGICCERCRPFSAPVVTKVTQQVDLSMRYATTQVTLVKRYCHKLML
jgi:hypothetical protein